MSPQLNVQATETEREMSQTVQCVYRYVQGVGVGDWFQDFLWITKSTDVPVPQVKGCTLVGPLDPHIQPNVLSLDEGTGLYSSRFQSCWRKEQELQEEDVVLALFSRVPFGVNIICLAEFSTTSDVGAAPYKPEN